MTEKEILDHYWPVIEELRKASDFYRSHICPDSVAGAIGALRKADGQCMIIREEN